MNGNERRDRAAAEASEWWLRLEASEMSGEDRLAFVEWLRESPLHVSEMLRMGQLHAVLDEFPDWDQISSLGSEQPDDAIVPFDRSPNDLPPRAAHPEWQQSAYGPRRYRWFAGSRRGSLPATSRWLSIPRATAPTARWAI